MPLEVICGPMFSGKTEELIRRIVRTQYAKQKVLCLKPHLDVRYAADFIQSHSGRNFPSVRLSNLSQVSQTIRQELVDLIAIEEAQFFEPQDFRLFIDDYVQNFQDKVKLVIAGLDLDFQGKPFENLVYAMALATKIEKLSAVCLQCGSEAVRTFKKVANLQRVELGAENLYEARCYNCWKKGNAHKV